MSYYRSTRSYGLILFWVLVIIVALACIIVPLTHVEYHTVTVTKTEIVGNNDHYMIFCKENGQTVTYTLDDSFWYGSWNTSDKYAEIELGQTYKIKTTGFRIPLFSSYKNIVDIEKLNKPLEGEK